MGIRTSLQTLRQLRSKVLEEVSGHKEYEAGHQKPSQRSLLETLSCEVSAEPEQVLDLRTWDGNAGPTNKVSI